MILVSKYRSYALDTADLLSSCRNKESTGVLPENQLANFKLGEKCGLIGREGGCRQVRS